MKGKGTVVLTLVFVALCIGYWGMLRLEKRGEVKALEAKRLFSFEPGAVVGIEIQRMDEPVVSASRQQGEPWKIEKPNASIEPAQVVWDRMAAATAFLLDRRLVTKSPKDLALYGLDKPVLHLTARTVDGKVVKVQFGSIEPTQTFRYAQLEDGMVFLTDTKMFAELDRTLSVLRFPYAVNVGKDGVVTRVEFAKYWTGKEKMSPDKPQPKVGDESVLVALERRDGKWRMVSPIEAEANSEMVEALVKEVQFATGQDYVDEPKNLADYGLEPPRARISLICGNSAPETLLLGGIASNDQKAGSGLFVKHASKPAVFVIDAQVLTLLPQTPDAFRENRLLTRQAADIASIHYVQGNTDIVLTQDDKQGWVMTKPAAADTDQVVVSNFVAFLKNVKGTSFPGDRRPEYGLEQPFVALTVNYKNGQPPAQIAIGNEVPDTKQRYAVQDNGVVTILNTLDIKGLTRSTTDFRKLSLLEFATGEAVKISLDFEGTHYVFEIMRGQWTISEPAGRTLSSQSDMDALLKTLGRVRAIEVESLTPPADLAPFALNEPMAVVSVTTKSMATPEQAERTLGPLKIGAPSPDHSNERFAMSEAVPGVFRISQSVVDDIRETLKNIR